MMEPATPPSAVEEQQPTTDQVIDRLIEEAVSDLSTTELEINSLAVWEIRTQAGEVDVTAITQKLITQLVALDRFSVVSRERLSELLDEQSLSVTGTIDPGSAVELGSLIGVEGFIEGYLAVENNRVSLSLNLIETSSGVIVWAKTLEGPVEP
jgi:TolB-like protein